MASFSRTYVDLPSYLRKWPSLHSDEDIDLYCKYSKNAESQIGRRTWLTEEQTTAFRRTVAIEFHRRLKKDLR